MVKLFELFGIVSVNKGQAIGDLAAINAAAAKTAKDLSKSLDAAGRSMQRTGMALTKALTLPLLAIGAVALNAGKVLQEANARIAAETGATGDALKKLDSDLRAVYAHVAAPLDQVTTAIVQMHQRTGASGDVLRARVTQALHLAEMMHSDVNAVVTESARLFANWKVATDLQSSSLDYLFRVCQRSGVGIDRLMELMTTYGTALRQIGMDFYQSAALLGQLEKSGANVERTMVGLMLFLRQAGKAGVDAGTAFAGLVQRIKDARTETEAVGIANVAFGRSSAVIAASIRAGTFDVTAFTAAVKASGDTIEDTHRRTEPFVDRLKELGHQATLALEPLGIKLVDALEKLVPVVERLLDRVKGLAEWFGNLSPATQDSILQFGAALVVLGPFLKVVGLIVSGIGKLIPAIRTAGGVLAWIAESPAAKALGVFAVMLTTIISLIAAYKQWRDLQGAAKPSELGPGWEKLSVKQQIEVAKEEMRGLEAMAKASDLGAESTFARDAQRLRLLVKVLEGEQKAADDVAGAHDKAAKARADAAAAALKAAKARADAAAAALKAALAAGAAAAGHAKEKKSLQDLLQAHLDLIAANIKLAQYQGDIAGATKLEFDAFRLLREDIAVGLRSTDPEVRKWAAGLVDQFRKLTTVTDEARKAWTDYITAIAEGGRTVAGALPEIRPVYPAGMTAEGAQIITEESGLQPAEEGAAYQPTSAAFASRVDEINAKLRDLYRSWVGASEEARPAIEADMRALTDELAGFEKAGREQTQQISPLWEHTAERIHDGFADAFTRAAEAGTGFVGFVNGLCDAIRRAWNEMVGDMVADWLFGIRQMKETGEVGGVLGGVFSWLGGALGMQAGGLVTHPTFALLGERGPELVLPLMHPGRSAELLSDLQTFFGRNPFSRPSQAVHFHEGAIQLSPAGMSEWDLYKLAERLAGPVSQLLMDRIAGSPAY